MSRRPPTALVTGGAGFIGTNLVERLLDEGWRVRLLDDLSRPGVETNLTALGDRDAPELDVIRADVRDAAAVDGAARGVEAIFHFAAQVAVTTSLEAPRRDLEVNLAGTFNVLEAARRQRRPPRLLFTSTNKVYGSLADLDLTADGERYVPADPSARRGIAETRPLQFATPYGCSKGAAEQYVLDWAASYGLATVVFRMSCIYGPHQCGTEDQGWVAHFLLRALAEEAITLYGDGRQVRDILYVDDLIDSMMLAMSGTDVIDGAFNIGGGVTSAVSLLEVIDLIAAARGGRRPVVRHADWRPGDQRYYVTDHARFSERTGWHPTVAPALGIERLHAWLVRHGVTAAVAA